MSGHGQDRGPSRRDFLVLGAGIFTVSTIGLTRGRQQVVRRTVPVMGTLAEIAVVSRDERAAHAAISAATEELHLVHRLMSRFDPASDIGRCNAGAWLQPVAVSAATATVVGEALYWASVPGSRFDPGLGRATALWDIPHRTAPPAAAEIGRLARREHHRGVRIASRGDGATIMFADADVALDLGGIAKGYGVDRAVAALREWGVMNALVNVGGDLYAMGTSEGGDPWRVGIRSPDQPGRLSGTLALEDRAVATSGDYEQFFEHDGRRYHHLLDPATAAPGATASHSVTVAAASCMAADAAATAIFGLPPGAAAQVLARAGRGVELVGTA
ncbi:MAG TPA: FAD:protein FMN transferase [Longimicrobiales bacterium]|nr:FAD:protein FMN transferase [Longimicrobiales bacterium]